MEPVDPAAVDEQRAVGAVDGKLVRHRAVVEGERAERRAVGGAARDDGALVFASLRLRESEDLGDLRTEHEPPEVEVVDGAVEEGAAAE